MKRKDLESAVREAIQRGAVVYIYTDGDYQINAYGLNSAIEMGGHDILCEIDCRDCTASEVDEIIEQYEEQIEEVLEH